MSIIEKLASALNRRDEVPNQELAHEIIRTQDKKAVQELVANLTNKKAIQNDCIKVLYEIGMQNPKMIADYVSDFIEHVQTKNNRLQWGIMITLNSITDEKPKEIYEALPTLLAAADKGSVITKDHVVNILIKLSSIPDYSDNAFTLLMDQILMSRDNQLPMYAERALPVISENNKTLFVETLKSRIHDIESESKRKRIEKVIKKANKL